MSLRRAGALQKKQQSQHLKEILKSVECDLARDEHYPPYHRAQVTYSDKIPHTETENAYSNLVTCLATRKAYMEWSRQAFPSTVSGFLEKFNNTTALENYRTKIHLSIHEVTKKISMKKKDPPPKAGNPWDTPLLPNLGYKSNIVKGVVQVTDQNGKILQFLYPTYEKYVEDLTKVVEIVSDGPVRSLSEKRLALLRSKYDIHINLNEIHELASMSVVAHKDFYNVLKVDTHIHAAACMTPLTLLARVEKAYEEDKDVPVLNGKNKGDPPITLCDLFKKLHLDPEDLSVDSLDVQAKRTTMERFDLFDKLYNVAGEADLRKVFLKPTGNLVKGKYFADLIKESFSGHKNSEFIHVELRISAGDTLEAWKELATWVKDNDLYDDRNRWVLQLPRTYPANRKKGGCSSFQEFISQAFLPMFLATTDPESYPEIAHFLKHVCAMDSVSDESVSEISLPTTQLPSPDEWATSDNPPYAYYLYYMYANLTILNQLRQQRGMNILKLRPHSGESGSTVHLAVAFLLAENISHGIQLTNSCSLEYLYYLAQIPIALSPLSNNALFLPYVQHPLRKFHAEGIPITVSTDDPLMFHLTSEPLGEEYSIAAQVFGLSNCDRCEMARNSVLMSGFPDEVKTYWLGENYEQPGIAGNDAGCSKVPDVRVAFRFETHINELYFLCKGSNLEQNK